MTAAERTCYIFAIGGTGARILESFTHMLAAGSDYDKLKEWQFVPIIIDLDKNNGDLKTCTELMDKYRAIHRYIRPEDENINYRFFRYPIKTLKEVTGHDKLSNDYILASNLTTNKNLDSLINYSTLGNTAETNGTRELIDLLFTKDDKEMRLDMGFKGKPHIGSVFFEQFSDLAENQEGALKVFIDQFDKSKDRIFIISSIFGGTGAAGFPWLVKYLRKNNKDTQKLEGVKIGALSVQPYFSVSSSSSSVIDSNSFHTKTKSALKYYSKNLENHLNAIYYIGDSESEIKVVNAEGGQNQKNSNSPIELIGASSILHFLNTKDDEIPSKMDGLAEVTKHYAYGLSTADKDKYTIYWNDLRKEPTKQENSRKRFFTPFLHFHIANIMVRKLLTETLNITWAKQTDLFVKDKINSKMFATIWDKSFFTNNFYSVLLNYMKDFTNWLDELKGKGTDNHLTYFPFEVDPDVGEKPNFIGLMNSIIKYTDLTEGKDLLLNEKKVGDTTIYQHGKNQVIYNNLINYMNHSEFINGANAIIVKHDNEKQQAQRLMYMLYNSSLRLLKENTAKALEVKKFLID